MAGGRIAPDGRPAQPPGVGKNARRHDLEAPATPGLSNSDLQQGDVQRLEQAQKIAPRPKRTQPSAAPQPNRQRQGVQRAPNQFGMEVPDPIEFAKGRIGGQVVGTSGDSRLVDASAWRPLVEMLALQPNSGGAIASSLVGEIQKFIRRPVVSQTNFVDLDEMDKIIGGQ